MCFKIFCTPFWCSYPCFQRLQKHQYNVVLNGTGFGRQEVYGGFHFFKTWSLWKVIAEFTTWFSCLIYIKLFQTPFADEGLSQMGVRALFPLTTGRNQKKREQWSVSQNWAKLSFKILPLSWVVKITLNKPIFLTSKYFPGFFSEFSFFDHC